MGGAGGSGADDGPDGAPLEDATEWPGLDSLPPTPPHEYPPARPYRRRQPPEPPPVLAPARVPASPSVVDEVADDAVHEEPVVLPASRRRRWRIAAGVAVVVLLVLAGVVAGRSRDEPEPDQAAGTTTSTAAPGSSTTVPEEPPPSTTTTLAPIVPIVDPPLDAAIAEGSAFVAAQRAFPLGAPVAAVRVPDTEFEERVRQQVQEDRDAIVAEGDMLKLLGVIPDDEDYLQVYLDTYPTLVGAYYDPELVLVVVRGEVGTPIIESMQVTLAHELTHTLDDRELGVTSTVFDDPYGEQRFSMKALIEGDAERIEHLWARAHGLAPNQVTVERDGGVVAERFAAAYLLGETLVDDIVSRGGEAELNRSFADPPSTSEQVIHPGKYAAREPVVPLDEPVADGEAVCSAARPASTRPIRCSAPNCPRSSPTSPPPGRARTRAWCGCSRRRRAASPACGSPTPWTRRPISTSSTGRSPSG